jgi:glycosyltransferase involved in cell wall biosynthesis
MPVYNADVHLEEAIESILVQTHADIELLIIDDASTDHSIDIIKSFNDKRIRLIYHTQNKGIRDTLNEGIKMASYELIARMDADDISHPWRLQKQVDYLLKHPECAMVSSLAKVIDKERNFVTSYDPYRLNTYYGLYFDCYICHSSVMYRKSSVQSVGNYSLEYAEDFDLWWKLSRVYKIHTLQEPLLLYRIHDNNHSKINKRPEYDEAERKIVQRNFHYLLGDLTQIPNEYIACYNYSFKSLLLLGNFNEVRLCMDTLDNINQHILSIENPNRNGDAILCSAKEKKRKILYELGLSLPYFQMIRLLIHHQYYSLIKRVTLKKVKRHVVVKRRIIKEMMSKKRKFSWHVLLWNN